MALVFLFVEHAININSVKLFMRAYKNVPVSDIPTGELLFDV